MLSHCQATRNKKSRQILYIWHKAETFNYIYKTKQFILLINMCVWLLSIVGILQASETADMTLPTVLYELLWHFDK